MFIGIAVERPTSLNADDIPGTEDIGPEDTFDGDFGRLLEAAYAARKGHAPGGNRTPGLQVRSLSLYPSELRAHA
jgi:hypothetical protein